MKRAWMMTDYIKKDKQKNTMRIIAPPYRGYRHEYIMKSGHTDTSVTSDQDEWRKGFPESAKVLYDRNSPALLRHRSIKHGKNCQEQEKPGARKE